MLQRMTLAGFASATALTLAGCSPAVDWREVPVGDTGLKASFPCKPDQEARQVTLAGRAVAMQAFGCRNGGATYAVLVADVGGPANAAAALQQWQAASLATLHARDVRRSRFHPSGALDLADSVQVVAAGTRPDGSHVASEAAYFAHGRHVFQAVMLVEQLQPELAGPFFAGLRFE